MDPWDLRVDAKISIDDGNGRTRCKLVVVDRGEIPQSSKVAEELRSCLGTTELKIKANSVSWTWPEDIDGIQKENKFVEMLRILIAFYNVNKSDDAAVIETIDVKYVGVFIKSQ